MQVVNCRGVSGNNAEYVTRLADFVRHHIPLDDDEELFQLDAQVRRLLTSDVSVSRFGNSQGPASRRSSSDDCDPTDRTCRYSRVAVTVRAG